uniref:Glucan endo-1,3-beta-D-glucosidase n=1 Tax=Nelumbo nucifera TaxID=4432 RepID=A0A822YEV9_NELNU|nr:TPA_asm: hypothetical protein HUJ06_031024 [Nelumbo nucifera]
MAVFSAVLLLGLLMASSNIADAQQIGVCYGMLGNNLPSKNEVVELYKINNIQRMRLYDPNREALQALNGSNIELMVGIPNEQLQLMASSDPTAAYSWVFEHVFLNRDDVKFKYIVVGNEVSFAEFKYILPAMRNIYSALELADLQNQIKVSTAVFSGHISETYPPRNSVFNSQIRPLMEEIVAFLVEKQAPLLANVYPFFAYLSNQDQITV